MFNSIKVKNLEVRLDSLRFKQFNTYSLYVEELRLKLGVEKELKALQATRTLELANFTIGFNEAWRENDKLQLAYGTERKLKEDTLEAMGRQAVTIAKQAEQLEFVRIANKAKDVKIAELAHEVDDLYAHNVSKGIVIKGLTERVDKQNKEIKELQATAARRYHGWARVFDKYTAAMSAIKSLTAAADNREVCRIEALAEQGKAIKARNEALAVTAALRVEVNDLKIIKDRLTESFRLMNKRFIDIMLATPNQRQN